MRNLLRKSYSIQLPRDRVMQILREKDPEGTARRRTHKLVRRDYFSFGSSFFCHCENYDKLKPYGLSIYGFSRKVILVEVCGRNSNPMVVRALKSVGLVQEMLRTDHGN